LVGDVLLVNVGDYSLAPDPQGTLKTEMLGKTMVAMEYDAIVPGERDLSMGIDMLTDLSKRIPFLSCNLAFRGETFGKPYLILERGDLEIGLVGVTKIQGRRRMPEGWEVKDPEERLPSIVKELEGKTDLLVGLFHVGLEGGKQLAAKFQEFDVVILGHGGKKLYEPFVMGRTIVLKGETQGKSLGRLDLEVGGNGETMEVESELIPLGMEVADHPGMKVYLDEYDKKRKELVQKVRDEKKGPQ
jgi:2',3'-cyclic-nucleotide 2'-phosphodiesterase (5'-nucleotidase family)